MGGKIYLLSDDGTLQSLREKAYANEDLLQSLLAKYPDLLAGEQIDESSPRRWLLVSREACVPGEENGIGRWYLDHLFLDQDAVPTLVEVKRSTDTRIRREVVGQMLDYAANAVVYWPVETIRAKFETNCDSRGDDSSQMIVELIEADPGDDEVIERFWQQVKTNLQAGRVRLVFVADVIPIELRRIVEFLNEQMDPAEVLAVEIAQYVGHGLRTLVPNVLGRTAASDKKKPGSSGERRQWDEYSFFQELENRRGKAEAEVARIILEWAKINMPEIYWGRGKQTGGFIPGLPYEGIWHQVIEVWTNGNLEMQFQYMKGKPPFDDDSMRLELLHRLNRIPGIALPEDSIIRRPSISLSTLGDEDVLRQFIEVLEWVVMKIRAA
jgi:hypothetical protein